MQSLIKIRFCFFVTMLFTSVQFANAQEKKEIKKFYPSGKLEGKGFVVNGKRTGTWTSYFENGNTSKKINYKNDVQDGLTISFFPDQKTNEQIYYSNGNVDSLYRYFRTGKVKEKTIYSNRMHDRKTILFDSIGTRKAEYFFRDGRLIKP